MPVEVQKSKHLHSITPDLERKKLRAENAIRVVQGIIVKKKGDVSREDVIDILENLEYFERIGLDADQLGKVDNSNPLSVGKPDNFSSS